MPTRIHRFSPHAQCYICYDPNLDNLDKVCHHCGRAICKQHQSTLILAESAMPNPEYKYLGLLGEETQEAIHCVECAQTIHLRRWFWRQIGWLPGGDWIQKVFYLNGDRPPIPTTPNVNGISVIEKMQGTISIDATGKYSETAERPTGELKVALQFLPRDQEVITEYCKRYKVPRTDPALPLHAGFLTIHNPANVCFDLPPDSTFAQVGVLELRSQLGTIEYLFDVQNPKTTTDSITLKSLWDPTFRYQVVRGDGKKIPLPIRLTPSIVPDDVGRSLELTIQINLDLGISPEIDQIRIDDLSIQVPQTVEPIIGFSPFNRMNERRKLASPPRIEVNWQGVDELSKKKLQTSVHIRYDKQLTPDMSVKGKIKVIFTGTLSGLKDARVFYPWGKIRSPKSPPMRRQTTVEVEFDLHLGHLRFQDLESRPPWQTEYNGKELNHTLVNELTDRLSKAQIYIKKIVEYPTQTSRTSADFANRFWDISGRRYVDAYPIDFHLTLTGEQFVGHVRHANPPPTFIAQPSTRVANANPNNRIKAELNVYGVVKETGMRGLVQQMQTDIIDILNQTL